MKVFRLTAFCLANIRFDFSTSPHSMIFSLGCGNCQASKKMFFGFPNIRFPRKRNLGDAIHLLSYGVVVVPGFHALLRSSQKNKSCLLSNTKYSKKKRVPNNRILIWIHNKRLFLFLKCLNFNL